MPARRGPARISQHRRARPCRRDVAGGPLRRRGRTRRSGHLLLPRRARLAVLLPLDDRAQHRRARRAEPVRRGRPLPVAPARERPRDRRRWTPGRRRSGPRTTTATCPCARRPGTAARSGWTVPRAASASSTRSTAVTTTSGSPSISAPMSQAELNGSHAVLRWPTAAHAGGGAAGHCRRSCGGACTAGRPIRSSAGTRPAWASACPPSRSSAAGRCGPQRRVLTTRLEFLMPVNRKDRPLSGQLYHSSPADALVERRGRLRAEAG